VSRPYPFCLAHPLEGEVEDLGDIHNWQRNGSGTASGPQLIRRHWQTFVWSRGEELVTDRFPELQKLGGLLPEGIAIDGEIMPWKSGKPMGFAQLQRRIGRKVLGPKILAEVAGRPAGLRLAGTRCPRYSRGTAGVAPGQAREIVQTVQSSGCIVLSERVHAESWEQLRELRRESRDRRVEGFMLKRLGSPYRVGRKRGDWWKWKIEPYTVDAVLVYAQPGSGRRASLFTDYTFAVWDNGELVPFAKAYSGLSDEEIRQVDSFVRRNTIEKFGPVRRVKPELVFELAFEGIQSSPRHRFRNRRPIPADGTLEARQTRGRSRYPRYPKVVAHRTPRVTTTNSLTYSS